MSGDAKIITGMGIFFLILLWFILRGLIKSGSIKTETPFIFGIRK